MIRVIKNKFLWYTLMFAALQAKAQSEIGLRVTPMVTSQPKVINPSPAKIYGENRISFEGGIDYTYYFKEKPYAIRLGTAIGIIDNNYAFKAPRKAFGTMTGEGNIFEISNYENYLYNSLSAQLVYKFRVKNIIIEAYTGLAKKFYQYSNEEGGTISAFNRAIPYDSGNPNAGPPDFLVYIPPIKNRLHLDIPLGIGIKRVYSNRSSLTFSLIKNWNIQPIGKGELIVQMYNQSYYGEFSPRSSFVGLDLRYGYILWNKSEKKERQGDQNREKSGYKKAVFLEAFGNGYYGSVNYDIRLKKDRNDGIGLRAGIGFGEENKDDNIVKSVRYITLPFSVNHVLGKKRSGLETGLGITPSFTFNSAQGYSNVMLDGYLNILYRYQPMKEGLVFRIGLTPNFDGKRFGLFYPSASIGYGFK
jgi:hypothetical protein